MAESPELPDRIKRDLEDALREGGVDKLPARPRRKRQPVRLGFPDPRPRNPGQLVLIGVGLILLAYLLPIPFKAQISIAGILCIVVAVVTHLVQPQGHVQKYWRGRFLDIPSGDWQEKLYRFIYHQK